MNSSSKKYIEKTYLFFTSKDEIKQNYCIILYNDKAIVIFNI